MDFIFAFMLGLLALFGFIKIVDDLGEKKTPEIRVVQPLGYPVKCFISKTGMDCLTFRQIDAGTRLVK